MATFGERFKEERKSKGLTQEQLAKKFFLNKSSISRYEKDAQIPEMPTLEKIADFFQVSIDYLLGKSDIKKQSIENEESEDKDIEQMIDELMEQQGLMLCGEPMSDTDKILLRNSIRSTIELAKTMRNRK